MLHVLKHIVVYQFKGSRYKGLYVLLPLMDFNEKLMDFNGFSWILIILVSDPDSRGSRELNGSLGRPGEGQGGPNKGQLDPKIGQNL